MLGEEFPFSAHNKLPILTHFDVENVRDRKISW